MWIYYLIIIMLLVLVIILGATILLFVKKSIYFDSDEKKYIRFVIDIFNNYGDDLGVQTKEEHKLLVDELNKIKNKIDG